MKTSHQGVRKTEEWNNTQCGRSFEKSREENKETNGTRDVENSFESVAPEQNLHFRRTGRVAR